MHLLMSVLLRPFFSIVSPCLQYPRFSAMVTDVVTNFIQTMPTHPLYLISGEIPV